MRAVVFSAFGRLIRSGLLGVCLLLIAVAAMGQEPGAVTQPPLPEGTKITQQNWQQYKSYMTQGLIEIWTVSILGNCRLTR